MARIRSIKPEFWTDQAVGECSPSARLLFVATWTFADDKGNLDRSARQLKAQAFPYDAVDCEPLLQELLRAGLLLEYDVDGKKFLHIKNFDKHQKIDKESKPRFPVYVDSARTPGAFAEPSESPRPGGESSGGEEEKEGRGAPAAPVLHASLPTEEWEQWLELRRKKRWPLDGVTLGKQLKILAEFDTATQRTMIDNSIQSGWQGIFPPKGGDRRSAASTGARRQLPDAFEVARRATGDR